MADRTPEPTEVSETAPRRIGPYRIDGVIGRGGMGEVLAGFDEALQRPVAVKRVAGEADADARARFWREARSLAALGHPGIVTIFQVGETDDGALYIAMERVDGRPLSEWLGLPWPASEAVAVARQVADALGAAHAEGIVHRDVKPANLLLQRDGQVRVVDFGLARRSDDGVTASGTRVGTPAYMAPEQVEGGAATPASDGWAVGVVLYRLLAGTHPFTRETRGATALAIASGSRVPLGEIRPDLPAALVAVVDRCLSPERAARFEDGAALAEALDRCGVEVAAPAMVGAYAAEPSGVETSGAVSLPTAPRGPAGARGWPVAVVLVALIGATLWWASRGAVPDPPRPAGISQAQSPTLPGLDGEALAPLPARPVVAVLDFEGPDRRVAEIAADALRRDLGLDPNALVSMRWAALGFADPERLTREGRRAGHVDVTIRGVLRAGRAVAVLTDTRDQSVRAEVTVPADGPVKAARALAPQVMAALGGEFPANPPPLTSPDAYGAYLDFMKASKAGSYDGARSSIDFALRLDAGFAAAAVGHLSLLRAEGRHPDLVTAAKALLARSDVPDRDRSMAEAFLALGEKRPEDALRTLHGMATRYPYDTEVLHAMLVLRFHMHGTQDMPEAERLARRILAISPRDDGAASRLVRSLSFRGRVAEAEAAMRATGVPEDDVEMVEVWGEMHLWAQRYDRAMAAFRAALTRNPDDLYAEHMGFATRILAGECEEAAQLALARISRIEARGKDSNLGWTYSLAVQSILCQGRWETAAKLLDRWAANGSDGGQVLSLRPRVALASGAPAEAVMKLAEAALATGATAGNARPELLKTIARVAPDATRLKRWIDEAEAKALDLEASPGSRRAFQRAAKALKLRARLLTSPGEEVLEGYRKLMRPWAEVNAEWQLGDQVEALVLYAEALEHLGRDARAVWRSVATLGYPRLWMSDLWFVARARMK